MNDTHMDFLVPLQRDLETPYSTNKELEDSVRYIFSHPKFHKKKRDKFIMLDKKSNGYLVRDMANLAFAMTKHFIDNKEQYGHKMENIYWQLLWRMWRKVYKYRIFFRDEDIKEYLGAEMKLLTIQNGLYELLIDSVTNDNCVWHYDDLVKKRDGIGLRDRKQLTQEGSDNFEWICKMVDEECVGGYLAEVSLVGG